VKLPEPHPVATTLPSDGAASPATAGGLRRWLKSDMRVLRWVFLALYLLLILSFLVMPAFADGSGGDFASIFIAVGVMLVAQALLIFGSGTISLCRPIRRRRLLLPVAIAATMLALLAAGLCIAVWELLYLDSNPHDDLLGFLAFAVIGLSWIGWGVLLMSRLRDKPRYTVLRRLTTYIFAGSLAELLATVPSHVIVSRRPGCLVGIGTALGIIAGCAVMIFSFGPAIVILFLRPRWRAELADGVPYCPACGYDLRASTGRCPECGLPFEADMAAR
jgi:hypothetical protein